MKRLLAAASLAVLAAACSAANDSTQTAEGDVYLPPIAENFQLVDQNHEAWELRYYAHAPAIVLASHALGDQTSVDAGKALSALQSQFGDNNLQVFLLNASETAGYDEVAEAAKTDGYADVRVLMDEYQLVSENLKVETTGEAFVIDPKTWQFVYRGPADEKLTAAVESLVAGETVQPVAYAAAGAPVSLPGLANSDVHANISYADDIAPVLVEKCAGCHTEGGIGPFAMTSYDVVKGFSPMIRESLRTDRMPPFFANRHTGQWLNDQNLTSDEMKTLVHWIEAGSPRGEGADPLVTEVKPAVEWPLGEPDVVYTIPAAEIPATGVVEYKYPAVRNTSTESKWLKASTIIPGDRTVLHHVLSGYMDEMPADGELAAQTRWKGSVGSYTPGAAPQILPQGTGVEVPAGGAIGFQMHYTTTGKAATDATRIGLYFHEEPPEFIKRSTVIVDATIRLEPGKAEQKEVAYMTFPHDAMLYTVYPHAHYRAVQASLEAHYPDGTTELILDLPRYDFNWQRDYDFAEPKLIPAGTRMVARMTYDNSEHNHANPDPTETVTWGDQTFEEMFYMRMNYRWMDETRENQVGEQYDREMMSSLMTGMVDNNLNGKIDPAEALKLATVMEAFGNALGGGSDAGGTGGGR